MIEKILQHLYSFSFLYLLAMYGASVGYMSHTYGMRMASDYSAIVMIILGFSVLGIIKLLEIIVWLRERVQ